MRARTLSFLGAIGALLLASVAPADAAVVPDGTFGDGGAVVHVDGTSAIAGGVATRGTKTYVSYSDLTGALHVLRLTEAGEPDATWGGGDGVADVALWSFGGAADVLVLNNGKVLVAGGATSTGMGLGVVRLTAAGVPDPSFSGDGKAERRATNVGRGQHLAVASNGRILVAGEREQVLGPGNLRSDFAVARFTANGGRDNTFSADGIAYVNHRNVDLLSDLAVDSSNRVLLMGDSKQGIFDLQGGVGLVARLKANGALDPAYSGDGKATFTFSGTSTVDGLGGGVDGANRVVFGVATMNDKMGAVRLTKTGALDRTYSGDGRAVAPFTGWMSRNGAARVGTTMVFVGWGSGGKLYVGRLSAAGAADTTLGPNGELGFDATGNETDVAVAAAAGPTGSLVTAGYTSGGTTTSVLVTRLVPEV